MTPDRPTIILSGADSLSAGLRAIAVDRLAAKGRTDLVQRIHDGELVLALVEDRDAFGLVTSDLEVVCHVTPAVVSFLRGMDRAAES